MININFHSLFLRVILFLITVITFLGDINETVKRDNMLDVIDCLQRVGCTLNEAYYEECYQALRQLQKRKVLIKNSSYKEYAMRSTVSAC